MTIAVNIILAAIILVIVVAPLVWAIRTSRPTQPVRTARARPARAPAAAPTHRPQGARSRAHGPAGAA